MYSVAGHCHDYNAFVAKETSKSQHAQFPLELGDRIGDPDWSADFLTFSRSFPIPDFKCEIGDREIFLCVHYSWEIQVNFSK